MNARTPLFNFTPDERKEYESATLRFTAVAQIQNYLDHAGLQAKDLAQRINKSRAWVSKLLSGRQNATLGTLADIGLALGARWQIELAPAERVGTPAEQDPPPPQWAATSSAVTFQERTRGFSESVSHAASAWSCSCSPSRDFDVSARIWHFYINGSFPSFNQGIQSLVLDTGPTITSTYTDTPGSSKASTVTASGYMQFMGADR